MYTLNGAVLSGWTTLYLMSCEAIAGRALTDEEVGELIDAALEHVSGEDLETTIAEKSVRLVIGDDCE